MQKKTIIATALVFALSAGLACADDGDSSLRKTFRHHKSNGPAIHHNTFAAQPITNTNTNIITVNTSATQTSTAAATAIAPATQVAQASSAATGTGSTTTPADTSASGRAGEIGRAHV